MGYYRTLWYAGGSYEPVLARTVHRGLGAQDDSRLDATCELTFGTGCSLFVQREIFERSGLFDDRYFLYWEDVGFRVGFCMPVIRFVLCRQHGKRPCARSLRASELGASTVLGSSYTLPCAIGYEYTSRGILNLVQALWIPSQ